MGKGKNKQRRKERRKLKREKQQPRCHTCRKVLYQGLCANPECVVDGQQAHVD